MFILQAKLRFRSRAEVSNRSLLNVTDGRFNSSYVVKGGIYLEKASFDRHRVVRTRSWDCRHWSKHRHLCKWITSCNNANGNSCNATYSSASTTREASTTEPRPRNRLTVQDQDNRHWLYSERGVAKKSRSRNDAAISTDFSAA